MIIITGMHRSGSSLAANILYELGMDFGNAAGLYGPDKWNPKGYFEKKKVFAINNLLLLGLFSKSRYWFLPEDKRSTIQKLTAALAKWRYFLPPSREKIELKAYNVLNEIRNISNGNPYIVLKDPRFCLTLSAWAQFTKIEKVLFCIRHPHEVAMSLKKRDGTPLYIGLKMWAYHNKEFISQADGLNVTFSNYNLLMNEKDRLNELERLFKFAGTTNGDQYKLFITNKIIAAKLRHNVASGTKLPYSVQYIWEEMQYYHKKYDNSQIFERNPDVKV